MKKIIFLVMGIFLLLLSGCGKGYSEGGLFKSAKELVAEAKSDITEITRDELIKKMESDSLLLIDVREVSEFENGYINEEDDDFEPYPDTWTVNIPRGILEFKIGSNDYWEDELFYFDDMPEKDDELILYCQTGGRSALAAFALKQLGYTNVKSLKGGYRKWLDPNAPEEEAVKKSGGCG